MALTKVTERIISDNLSISGVATAGNFKTGTTNVHNVGVELAGINVLGGDTPIGTGATIWKDGGALFSGIVTATSFKGDGLDLTGISGFATALSNTQGSLLNQVFKTPEIFTVGAGTSITISSDNMSGNVAFAKLGVISVGVGATLHVGSGTTMKMNILNVFP